MTMHRPFTTRPARVVVIRTPADLQAYLYARPAPMPAVHRVDLYARFDRALRGVVLGK